MNKEELQKGLIKNFRIRSTNFYDVVEFRPHDIGFSVKRKFGNKEKHISLIKVAIRNARDTPDDKKIPLYVGAAYGVLNDQNDALIFLDEDEHNFKNKPIDIESVNDYFFDIKKQKIFKHDTQITGKALLSEIYKAHIASWKTYRGLVTRIKLGTLRFLSKLFSFVSKSLEFFLYIISGDRYSFDPIMQSFEEEINRIDGPKGPKEESKESKKIKFLENEASAWAVIFYCILHLTLYAIFITLNYKPTILITLFSNNFLTITYAVVTLWVIDSVLPTLLKRMIKALSNTSFNYKYHKISIKL